MSAKVTHPELVHLYEKTGIHQESGRALCFLTDVSISTCKVYLNQLKKDEGRKSNAEFAGFNMEPICLRKDHMLLQTGSVIDPRNSHVAIINCQVCPEGRRVPIGEFLCIRNNSLQKLKGHSIQRSSRVTKLDSVGTERTNGSVDLNLKISSLFK